MQGTQPISKLLDNTEGNLQRLLAQAKVLQQLSHEIRQYLPEPLAPYCLIANIRGNRLILHTDTAARASLLRYHAPTLIKHLQQHRELHHLRKAIIRVRPLPLLSTAPQRPRPQISQSSAALLHNIAMGIKDPRLKAAFLRLARRAKS